MSSPLTFDSSLSTNTTNSLIHLYRAEVARMTSYRLRLDLSTNWAVITTAGLVSYAFAPSGTHVTMLAAMLMNYAVLHVEARRFRAFEVSHLRVRILEKFFYREVLGEEVSSAWHEYLIADLHKSHLPLARLQALGWRLRHNYLWIYAAILIAWLVKLDSTRTANQEEGLAGLVRAASVGAMPGTVFLVGVTALYVALIVLAWRAPTYPLEMD